MSFSSPIIPSLLGGLWNESKKVRKKVLKCFSTCLEKPVARTNYAPLLKALVTNKAAISLTTDNIPEVVKAFKEETRSSSTILDNLLEKAMDCDELFLKLSPIFSFLEKNGAIQLALHLTATLAEIEENSNKRTLLQTILQTNGKLMVNHLEEVSVWEAFTSGLKCQSTASMLHNGIDKLPSCVFIDTLSDNIDVLIDTKITTKMVELFHMLVDLSSLETISPEQLASARHVILELLPSLEDSVLLQVFYDVWGEDLFVKSRRGAAKGKQPITNLSNPSLKWQKTVFFIEVASQKFANMSSMLHPLSVLLKKALHEQAEQDHTYILELLIGCMLSIVDNFDQAEKEANPLDPELIVQCIRYCTNPDTKASALMLLAKSTASHNAEYILHNTIQLFTFVGTHFLQVESQSNFDIACTAIDVLVPHILQACQAKGGAKKVHEMSINILKTFVDASSDIPRHRFCVFMHQLIQKLGAKEFLWLLTLMLISDPRKKWPSVASDANKNAKGIRLDEKSQSLRDLFKMFDDNIIIQVDSMLSMIKNTRKNEKSARALIGINEAGHGSHTARELFDIARVKTLAFAQSLLSSQEFVRQIVRDLHHGNKPLEAKLQELLEMIIVVTDEFHKQAEAESMDDQASLKEEKIQKLMANCLERVFESTLAVIPTSTFVKVLVNLLKLDQPKNVQRKALEVLNARLSQQQDDDNFLQNEELPSVIGNLAIQTLNGSGDVNQQLALMCVKSLAKVPNMATSSPSSLTQMKNLCSEMVKKSFFNSLKQGPVIAAALICLVELFTCLGAHAVAYIKPFMNWILDLLSDNLTTIDGLSSVVLNSLVVSVQRTIDNFGGFLNPYYPKLVTAACEVHAWHQKQKGTANAETLEYRQIGHRIKQFQTALSRGISTHSLISISKTSFDTMVESPYGVIALANIIRDNISELDKSEVMASSTPLLDMFMNAFKYRENCQKLSTIEAHAVEEAIGGAFMSFALKLSLEDFKPFYYRIFNLALDIENLEGVSTLFHITAMVANKLKSLFGFVCEMVVQKSTSIMQEIAKKKNVDDSRQTVAIGYVLEALAEIYKYNRVDSLLMKNYEDHVNSITEHLDGENTNEEFLGKVKDCLGQLAATTEDDTQWKYLNYQVLMLIRSRNTLVSLLKFLFYANPFENNFSFTLTDCVVQAFQFSNVTLPLMMNSFFRSAWLR